MAKEDAKVSIRVAAMVSAMVSVCNAQRNALGKTQKKSKYINNLEASWGRFCLMQRFEHIRKKKLCLRCVLSGRGLPKYILQHSKLRSTEKTGFFIGHHDR